MTDATPGKDPGKGKPALLAGMDTEDEKPEGEAAADGAAPAEGGPALPLKDRLRAIAKALPQQILGQLKSLLSSSKSAVTKGEKGLAHGIQGIHKTGVTSIPSLLLHGDLATRILVVGFVASIGLVAMTGSQIFHRFMPTIFEPAKPKVTIDPKVEEEERHLHEAAGKMVFLRGFTGELVGSGAHPRNFDFELYVETDEPRTAGVLRAHIDSTREAITVAVQGHTYEELFTEAGKNALKKDILDAGNRALAALKDKGSVRRVYFTRFVME